MPSVFKGFLLPPRCNGGFTCVFPEVMWLFWKSLTKYNKVNTGRLIYTCINRCRTWETNMKSFKSLREKYRKKKRISRKKCWTARRKAQKHTEEETMGCRLAQLVEQASYVQRLHPWCSGPRFKSQPHSPSLSSCVLPSLKLFCQ